MSRSWKTMRNLRENPEFENPRRTGMRGIPLASWHRPEPDEGMPFRDRFRDRVDRSRVRLGAGIR